MTAEDVLSVLALLRRAEVDVWIGGGWGTDVLIGEQTRQYRDLDLMHRQSQEAAVVAALSDASFEESLSWRPIRFAVTAPDGREIDLHSLVFADDGAAIQASPDAGCPFIYTSSCFVTGTIEGVPVPCLSAEQQVHFHQGYEFTDRDRHDMPQFRRAHAVGRRTAPRRRSGRRARGTAAHGASTATANG
ncbi:amino acid transporter [Streptomyces sp. NPDC005562]|uniref:nucleotidyltransferase domain-containing protein n=1 Tax=Streptomyces sp. NPDC005562 TaxID=3154890 RepID=UPI0033ADA771